MMPYNQDRMLEAGTGQPQLGTLPSDQWHIGGQEMHDTDQACLVTCNLVFLWKEGQV